MHRQMLASLTALVFLANAAQVAAAPLALLDRNGSYVAIEAYAPNIVRITMSLDKELALGTVYRPLNCAD